MRNDLPSIYHQRIPRQSTAIELVEDSQPRARFGDLSQCSERRALCVKRIERVEHIDDVEAAGEYAGNLQYVARLEVDARIIGSRVFYGIALAVDARGDLTPTVAP